MTKRHRFCNSNFSEYRAFINDSKDVFGHEFQKSHFAEIMSHYDSSHLSLMSFLTCHLKSSFLLCKILFFCAKKRKVKMVYSVEQDTFIVMSCYRNGTFVNEESEYSVTACKQEYQRLTLET